MSNVLLLFIILSIASGLLFFFIKHSKNADLLPGQKKMVLDLIRELKTSRIDIIFADKSGEKHSATLNLFEARFYLESSKELANDRYNELPLFFSDDPGQVLNFKKFIKRPDFPQEIMDELMDFYNSAYEIVSPEYPYFIIMTDIPSDTEQTESTQDGLFKGNGEAFQSWLSFKECADNLNYVIGQWIKENEKISDSELHAEFL
jgi:hypothetical protein